MNIKEEINWLSGFLDSLLLSEDISAKQIEALKEKFTSLIKVLEDDRTSKIPELKLNTTPIKTYISKKNPPTQETSNFDPVDDLPF